MMNQIKLWQTMLAGFVRSRAENVTDSGASLVEYALLLALIAVVAIAALTFLGNTVSNTLNNVSNIINNHP